MSHECELGLGESCGHARARHYGPVCAAAHDTAAVSGGGQCGGAAAAAARLSGGDEQHRQTHKQEVRDADTA